MSDDRIRAEDLFRRWIDEGQDPKSSDLDALCLRHPKLAQELRRLAAEHTADRPSASPAGDAAIRMDLERASGPADSWATLLDQLRSRGPAHARYTFEGELARGGMGVVHRVYDHDARRRLALKVMIGRGSIDATGQTPNVPDATLCRFLEEAQITSQLDHPGIVPVHEIGVDASDQVYFTMKLVKGEDLRAIFDRVRDPNDHDWSQARALGVMLRVCEAMNYAHEKGVIHRDLKPGNVMVGKYGEVFVMDWGLARVLGRDDARDIRIRPDTSTYVSSDRAHANATPDSPLLTADGAVVGTPAYMAPEQAKGRVEDVGPLADVYSLGAMLYHLVAGVTPYSRPGDRISARTVLGLVTQGPPSRVEELNPDAAPELVAIVEKAMSREMADRYRSTRALADDLRAFLEDRVVLAHRTGPFTRLLKIARRNRPATIIAGAGLAATLGVLAWSWSQITTERDDAVASAREADRRAKESRRTAYAALISRSEQLARDGRLTDARALLDSCPTEYRAWEWRFLQIAANAALATFEVRPGSKTELSPDGERIAIADGPLVHVVRTVGVHEASSFDPAPERLASLAWSSDGATLVALGYETGGIHCWAVSDGRLEQSYPLEPPQVARLAPRQVAVSRDGSRVAATIQPGIIRYVDRIDGARSFLHSSEPAAPPNAVALDDDGKILTCSAGAEILQIDTDSQEVVRRLTIGNAVGADDVVVGESSIATASHSGAAGMPENGFKVWRPLDREPTTVGTTHRTMIGFAGWREPTALLTLNRAKGECAVARLFTSDGMAFSQFWTNLASTDDCSTDRIGSRFATRDATRVDLWSVGTAPWGVNVDLKGLQMGESPAWDVADVTVSDDGLFFVAATRSSTPAAIPSGGFTAAPGSRIEFRAVETTSGSVVLRSSYEAPAYVHACLLDPKRDAAIIVRAATDGERGTLSAGVGRLVLEQVDLRDGRRTLRDHRDLSMVGSFQRGVDLSRATESGGYALAYTHDTDLGWNGREVSARRARTVAELVDPRTLRASTTWTFDHAFSAEPPSDHRGVESGTRVGELEAGRLALAMPDGRVMALGRSPEATGLLWKIDREVPRNVRGTPWIRGFATMDGRIAAVLDDRVVIVDTRDGGAVQEHPVVGGGSCAFHPAEERLALTIHDGGVQMIDTGLGQTLVTLSDQQMGEADVPRGELVPAFDESGRLLVLARGQRATLFPSDRRAAEELWEGRARAWSAAGRRRTELDHDARATARIQDGGFDLRPALQGIVSGIESTLGEEVCALLLGVLSATADPHATRERLKRAQEIEGSTDDASVRRLARVVQGGAHYRLGEFERALIVLRPVIAESLGGAGKSDVDPTFYALGLRSLCWIASSSEPTDEQERYGELYYRQSVLHAWQLIRDSASSGATASPSRPPIGRSLDVAITVEFLREMADAFARAEPPR